MSSKIYDVTRRFMVHKALMVERPWFVDKVQFDRKGGKLEFWINFSVWFNILL